MKINWQGKGGIVVVFLMMTSLAPAQVMKYVGTKATMIESGGFLNQPVFPIQLLEVKTAGNFTPLTLLQFNLKSIEKEDSKEFTVIVYYTGSKDSFSTTTLFARLKIRNRKLVISGQQELQRGSNYFWVTIEPQVSSERILPALQLISCTTGLQDYKQTWADEFSNDGPPDSTHWRQETGFVRNEEDQWYQPDNAVCKNGILTIQARRDSIPNPCYEEGSRDWRRNRKYTRYTSSSINTRGQLAWTYGRWEMRARLDTNAGCWPAWWALGTEGGGWPANGEIDMMEFYRGKILANYAVATQKQYTAKWFSTATPIADFRKQNWTDSFHNWRMDWDSLGIAIYLDDTLLNYQPQSALYNRTGDNSYYPFRHPQYMLLNFAIGGQNGGDPSGTSFPRKYEIDYVRVAQKIKGRYTDKAIHHK